LGRIPGDMKSSIAEMATTLGEDIQICIQCGVCSGSCPVASEMEYTPRKIIAMVRAEMEDEILASESIWRCLSCYLCQVRCPREIKLIDKIVDTRRHLVQEEAKFPQEMIQVFRDIEVYGDTFGMGRSSRLEWAHGLGVEEASEKVEYDALLWLGCEDTFNDRRMQVSRTLVKVLQKAGVKFAALGRNEACCGDPARRLGNEYLFQEMASKNIETLNNVPPLL
jgi:Fe-S oxidoreductase